MADPKTSILGNIAGAVAGGPWGAALMAVPSLISLFTGKKQKKEGEELAANNVRPIFKQSPEYEDMLQFFEKQAQFGLDANSMAYNLDQSNRGLTTSLNAMLQAGGDPNNVSALYSSYADNIARTAAQDSEARWNKVNVTANAMDKLINSREKEFLYNKDAPYKDTAQLASAKQQAGNQAEMQGWDMLFGNTAKMLNQNYQSKTFADTLKSIFTGQGAQQPAGTTATGVAPAPALPTGQAGTGAGMPPGPEGDIPTTQATGSVAALQQALEMFRQIYKPI